MGSISFTDTPFFFGQAVVPSFVGRENSNRKGRSFDEKSDLNSASSLLGISIIVDSDN
jgi:hypothetical protein